MILKGFHDVGDGRSLLSDGDIDAVESVSNLVGIVEGSFLVDDGVNSDGSLTSLSISNDKFSLTSSNRDLFKIINSKDSMSVILLLYR